MLFLASVPCFFRLAGMHMNKVLKGMLYLIFSEESLLERNHDLGEKPLERNGTKNRMKETARIMITSMQIETRNYIISCATRSAHYILIEASYLHCWLLLKCTTAQDFTIECTTFHFTIKCVLNGEMHIVSARPTTKFSTADTK